MAGTSYNENTRGQDIPYNQLSISRRKALFSDIPRQITPELEQVINYILPYMRQAVKTAEGNPKNFGVLSVPTDNPEEADKVLIESIRNNYLRWIQAGKPGTFVDFMRDRWAPVGAENDPKNLNPNWNDNVRARLLELLGPEKYKIWERSNVVMAPGESYNAKST